jgi:hypothetical protein
MDYVSLGFLQCQCGGRFKTAQRLLLEHGRASGANPYFAKPV